ncbi:hypothetical protein DL764_007954 [Monosporascus ibericus]|uniref:Thioesterase domain-containing protein n=1 Tax=Monosporascus ibericus TaxID=155417 RepID=A0A4Q4T0Z2_9PEZI|nr:hypothetical protein DL764_007954 [Monosporascus ibericus]
MESPEESVQGDLKLFMEIPWCAKHLNRPDTTIWIPYWKRKDAPPQTNLLFARSLNTTDTLPAVVACYQKQAQGDARVDELKAFVALGEGVGGFPGVLHGGVTTAVFDEVLGMIVDVNHERGVFHDMFMTAYLNTSFVRPVPVPGTVLVAAKLVELGERKMLVAGTMQDENETVLAKAEALFVRVVAWKL